jgi:hypothetical protein
MEDISIVMGVLTSMITPAIFILACGSLTLTTSQRLNRSIDRTRKISAELKEIGQNKRLAAINEKKMLFGQLLKATRRASLLQRSMTLLYIALGFFTSSSLFIGLIEILNLKLTWILILLAMLGAFSLLMASFNLILETRRALLAVDEEMSFRHAQYKEYLQQDMEQE